MNFLSALINVLAQVLIILVIVSVIMSYFLSPYHPARQFVDRIVEPLLDPIRRVVPLIGMFDISPLILILLIQLASSVLLNLLSFLR